MTLNQVFLSKIREEYTVNCMESPINGFSLYGLSSNKKEVGYTFLVLCKDYDSSHRVEEILNGIDLLEKGQKKGNSYLCIMSAEKPTVDLCTYFNGKSFVHFILLDNCFNKLVYDKKFYYYGGKIIKRLMDTYQKCFTSFSKENGFV